MTKPPEPPPDADKLTTNVHHAALAITKQLAEMNQRLERIERHTSSTRDSTHWTAWFTFGTFACTAFSAFVMALILLYGFAVK